MTDEQCLEIQSKAMIHLICCAFDDWSLCALEMAETLEKVVME